MTPAAGGPLAGLRVLDLAALAGAHAGRVLASLGADVVLIEPPDGHPTRCLPAHFAFYAAGKRSVVADRGAPAGGVLVERLAEVADAVVVTDGPAEAAALAARHPLAVVASITPFGHGGPRAAWAATDLVAQATGGLAFVNGQPDAPPLQALGLQAYHQAGVFAAIGVLAELLGGPRGAGGRLVDVSLQAAVASSLEHVPGLFLGDGTIPHRQGTLHWTRAFRAGRCADGWVLHSTMGDWTSLAAWLIAEMGEGASVLADPRFEDQETRRAEAETIFAVLDRWAATRLARDVVDGAQLRRLPYAELARTADLPHHPQLRARGFFREVPGVPLPLPSSPFLLDGQRLPVGAPPRLGADQDAVLREWSTRRSPASPLRRPGRRPLADVDVLDFTWVVAGPVATRTLADLGARVAHVEHPETPVTRDRRGGFTGSLARGKQSIVIDLRHEAGRRLARDLALHVDIVADNFSARVMPQLGLDAATLRHERPDLVCLSMSGYGATGPWTDRVSYGPTLQAEAGFTLGMHTADGRPAGLGYSYSDLASGALAALAVLAALWRRRAGGGGASIDFSQLEALAGLVGPMAKDEGRMNASQEEPMAPHGLYPAAGDDRWIAVAAPGDEDWRRLARAMGREDLAADPRLATYEGRRAAADEIDAAVAAWTRTRPADDAAEILQRTGVPAGLVADARDLLSDDPQLGARRLVAEVATREGRRVRLDGSPIRLSDAPTGPTRAGAELGEHTRTVLSERLGLTGDALDALETAGIIVQWKTPGD